MSKNKEPLQRWVCDTCKLEINAANEHEAIQRHDQRPLLPDCDGDVIWVESVNKSKERPNF